MNERDPIDRSRQRQSTNRVRIGAGDVCYRSAGDGPALVLLHGFGQDSRVWRSQLEQLRDSHRVIAWDAPGAGDSFEPPETFEIGDWANALAEFFEAMRVPKAHVVGLSWGGLLAQEYYRRFPDRVSTLVLADTYAGWTGSLSAKIAAERLARAERDSRLAADEFVALYLPGMFSASPPPEEREELGRIMSDFHPLGFRLMAAALAKADTRELLPKIGVPTLLVWGDQDARSPLSVGEAMHRAIPGSRLVVLRGAGHMSNMESADEFSAAVRDFLRPAPTR